MNKVLAYFLSITVLIILGFLTWKYFLSFSLSLIDRKNIVISSRKLGGQFNSNLIFALSFGTIPLLYSIIKKTTKISSIKQSLISLGIILTSGIVLWGIRIWHINYQSTLLSKFMIENEIKIHMEFGDLNFELYLFMGFLIGMILSILIYKNRSNSNIK